MIQAASRVALALSLMASAGSRAGTPQAPAAASATPSVTFTLDFPGARPPHVVITVEESGRTRYASEGPLFPDAPDAGPYSTEFAMSAATRARIFALAAQLDYFQGDFDYKKHNIAFLGRKTLAYQDPQRSFSTSYNWSDRPEVRELTEIFQDIINTQEAGRRLAFLLRYEPLGLEAELADLEGMAKSHRLGELESIAPLLEQIAGDEAVMHVARQRAQRLARLASNSAGK